MPLVIEGGVGVGVYDKEIPRPLLDAVAVVINRDFPGIGVRRGPLPFIHSADYYRFASLDALALYMLEVDARGTRVYNNVAPTANLPAPSLTYGAAHGDLHFGGDPTSNKAKWSETKVDALALMSAAILPHLPRMRRESKIVGWELWYIATHAPRDIGFYYEKNVRGGSPIDVFTMQVQVNWLENDVSFHGYPDEKILGTGLGKSRGTVM